MSMLLNNCMESTKNNETLSIHCSIDYGLGSAAHCSTGLGFLFVSSCILIIGMIGTMAATFCSVESTLFTKKA